MPHKPLVEIARVLGNNSDWFTLTKAVVRVSASLGGYIMDVEGPDILDELEAMQEEMTVVDVVSISGVAHPPINKDWVFAFRVDDAGPRVAANAPAEALEEIAPRLRAAVGN